MLSLTQFDYLLPTENIAQTPTEKRDQCKLLVTDRQTQTLEDRIFADLSELLNENDVLVLNNTKVFPARLYAWKGEKHIELLLENEVSLSENSITFSALSKPGLKLGDEISIPNTDAIAVCTKVNSYTRELKFNLNREELFAILDQWAHTPIPPYIKWNEDDELNLREKYQTVFAKNNGAIAAPTAGLHFTRELLEKLKNKGVQIEYVTLHVGLGTFLPVKTDNIAEHEMHQEWFELEPQTASRLNIAKQQHKRIIAVGTTVIRVLESCATAQNMLEAKTGFTGIFIYPPYQFKFVDSLITNFHTPKSTLLMLVTALTSNPNTSQDFSDFKTSLIGKAYEHALKNNYRFYSFGDAMWIK